MTPQPSWARVVRDRARTSGVELPPQAIVELAEHLDDLYSAARAGGATDADARAVALRALDESPLGDLTAAARLRARPPLLPALALHARHPLRSTNMFQAFRLALRQFSQQRTFAVVTVLILGLGIGAAVTVYTIVDSVVLKPLPYREPDRLVMMWETNHEKGLRHELLSPVNFMDYRTMTSFADSAGWWRPTVNIAEPGSEPMRVSTIETSANLFDLLGVVPQLGAGFPKEPFYSPDLIAVISDRLWRTRYNADPSIVGKQLQFNNVSYTITGVMAPGFHFPDNVDVWWRVQWDYQRHSRAAHFMEAIGRLAPGRTIDQASDELKTLTARLGEQFAATNRAWSVRLVSVLDEQLGYYRPALAVLFGAVALLCAIGCLNVASLLLTRSLSREREMAVRTAMGATPRHMIVQLLAEGAVLSIGGALAGVAAAFAALPLIVATTPVEIPRLAEASINLRVLGFAVVVAILTTMIFGLVPALVLMKRNLAPDLRSGERGSSRGSRTIYHGLVAGEVALACALLVSSGLLVRSVGRMMDVPTGVGNGAALSASVQLTAAVPNWPDMPAKYGAILDQIRQTPGVRTAGATNALPLELGWRMPFSIEGAAPVRAEDAPQAQYQSVTEGYFEAIGARVVDGRFFTSRDDASMPGALVVNETFAKKFFGDGRAVGRHILLTSRGVGPLGRNLLGLPPPERRQPRRGSGASRGGEFGVRVDWARRWRGAAHSTAAPAADSLRDRRRRRRRSKRAARTGRRSRRVHVCAPISVRGHVHHRRCSGLDDGGDRDSIGVEGRRADGPAVGTEDMGSADPRPVRRAASVDERPDLLQRARGRARGTRRLRVVLVVGGAAPPRTGDPADAGCAAPPDWRVGAAPGGDPHRSRTRGWPGDRPAGELDAGAGAVRHVAA